MAAKYFRLPFSVSGTKVTVPDDSQPDGTVSYTDGYGGKYSLNPNTDPSALNVERTKMNDILYDVTNAIKVLQQQGYPDFITSSDNGGTPYSYSIGNVVRYSGAVYQSLVNSNTTDPSNTSNWALINQLPVSNRTITAGPAAITSADGNGLVSIALTVPAPLVLTLPAISATPNFLMFNIKCNGAVDGTNFVTVTADGADLIEGQGTFVLDLPYGSITLYTNGIEWLVR